MRYSVTQKIYINLFSVYAWRVVVRGILIYLHKLQSTLYEQKIWIVTNKEGEDNVAWILKANQTRQESTPLVARCAVTGNYFHFSELPLPPVSIRTKTTIKNK